MFKQIMGALGLSAAMEGLFANLRSPTRYGPGRKTLYTRWKNVAEPHRSSAPVITWPDPLTRQCRRQLDRQAAALHGRRMVEASRARIHSELKESRAAGMNLPAWRAMKAAVQA